MSATPRAPPPSGPQAGIENHCRHLATPWPAFAGSYGPQAIYPGRARSSIQQKSPSPPQHSDRLGLLCRLKWPKSSTKEARIYFYTTPIVPVVRGPVIEVPIKANEPLKKG